jgi:hypothetical protein
VIANTGNPADSKVGVGILGVFLAGPMLLGSAVDAAVAVVADVASADIFVDDQVNLYCYLIQSRNF